MELSAFVQKTISEVISGVREARKEAVNSGASLGSTRNGGEIQFDVAITASESLSQDGGGGIVVMGIGVKGGGQAESANTTVSRVRFSVPVDYPKVEPDPNQATWGPAPRVR